MFNVLCTLFLAFILRENVQQQNENTNNKDTSAFKKKIKNSLQRIEIFMLRDERKL